MKSYPQSYPHFRDETMGRYVEARDDSAASARMPLVTLGGSPLSAMSALLGRAAVKADMPKCPLRIMSRKALREQMSSARDRRTVVLTMEQHGRLGPTPTSTGPTQLVQRSDNR